ncbi:MAG: hypothetical protein ACXWCS_10720 [Burkholderiales bacterium]
MLEQVVCHFWLLHPAARARWNCDCEHVEQILHRHGHAHQRTEIGAAAQQRIDRLRRDKRLLPSDKRICAELGIALVYAVQEFTRYLFGRDLFTAEPLAVLGGALKLQGSSRYNECILLVVCGDGTSICTTCRYSLIFVVLPVVFLGVRLARAASERQAARQGCVVAAAS